MNKVLNSLISKGVLEDIANDLKLKQVPSVVYDGKDDIIMSASGTIYHSPFDVLTKTITWTETDYVIHVNNKNLKSVQMTYMVLTGSVHAKYDITLTYLRHECRHIWQYQEQCRAGENYTQYVIDTHKDHGSTTIEKDANQYSIDVAFGKVKSLAIHAETLQHKDNKTEQIIAMLDMVKAYNPFWFIVVKVLIKTWLRKG